MSQLLMRVVPTVPIYTDRGSNGDHDIAIFQPVVPDDWYWLGHCAVAMPESFEITDTSLQRLAPYALAVKPALGDASDVLCFMKKAGKEALWTDEKSGGDLDIALFNPQPESDGYKTMSLFAMVGSGDVYGVDPSKTPPWKDLWSRLVAIKTDMLTDTSDASLDWVWSDLGMGARGSGTYENVTIFRNTGTEGGLAANTMYATNEYPVDPSGFVPDVKYFKEFWNF